MPELRLGLNDKVSSSSATSFFIDAQCTYKVQSYAVFQITRSTSGTLWVYWTWQVKVSRVGRCQVSPMRSVVQVLCLINQIWKIEIELEQSRFENDRTISFIPPDGEFELMSYRLNTHVKVEQCLKNFLAKYFISSLWSGSSRLLSGTLTAGLRSWSRRSPSSREGWLYNRR